MKLSPPSPADVLKAKFCIVGWTAIGLVACRGLGSNLEAFKGKLIPDIFASNVLVEGAEPLLVATYPRAVSAETVHRGDQ